MLEQLSGEDFARPVEPLFQSSIGAHYRHILDHYHCFFAGLANGAVDYDSRNRNPRVESDRDVCGQTISAVIDQLKQLESAAPGDALQVCLKTSTDETEAPIPSTLAREMVFLHGHTTHHFALIAAMMRVMDYTPGESLGVAPSTVDYQRRCAQ